MERCLACEADSGRRRGAVTLLQPPDKEVVSDVYRDARRKAGWRPLSASQARQRSTGLASEATLHGPGKRGSAPSIIGYWPLKVPVPLDMALADNFPVAVNEVELTEFVVFIFEIDGPIASSGGSRIGTPG